MAVLTESRSIRVSRKADTLQAIRRTATALGICSTCGHVDDCTSRATWVGPVYHCEEFDDRIEVSRPKAAPQRSIAESVEAVSMVQAEPVGLCMNCAHEKTCGLRRGEGGVWHCEEYE